MRKITINLAAVAAFCIVVASPALVSSSCATPKTEQEDTTIIREDSGITALKYSSPEVPASIEFCGKTIDLSRFDRHERMDRELLAFTYMHSTSLQMLKKANRYFPIVEPILKENGIPDDFKYLYNPQIQISAESETKRSIFREKDKTKRSKKESAQHSKSRNKSFVMTSVSAL